MDAKCTCCNDNFFRDKCMAICEYYSQITADHIEISHYKSQPISKQTTATGSLYYPLLLSLTKNALIASAAEQEPTASNKVSLAKGKSFKY